MEKLKIVHISETFIGGVYTYLRQLSDYTENDGRFKTFIVYSADREETNEEAIRKDFTGDTELIRIDMTREISFFRDLKSLIKIISLIRKIKPDIIHLHSSKAGVLGRAAQFFLFRKKVLFYTPHGYSFLRTDISRFKKKLYWSIEKSFQTLFSGETIACGDTEFEIATEIGKSALVRNGIDIEEVQRGFNENENSILKIGITGRIAYQRNPQLFNQIALKFPNYQFVWIGDGDLRQQLTAPNIRITGWIGDRKLLLKEVNDLDIYMHTSIWEGLPIAILEAMALEKTVIATNVIGNKDIVSHNETGFLFDDINELDAYFEILKDKNTRIVFGKKGLERCKLLFDINKNFHQLLSMYKSRFCCNT
jgi:glycosyltransferase involved in cell wall biosynthesis